MRRVTFAVLFCAGILGLAACGQSATTKGAAAGSACTKAAGISQAAETSAYRMVLDVGPREVMYTPAQAKAQHPSHGEVMLRGEMSKLGTMGSMGKMGKMGKMGSTRNIGNSVSARHLEVHICARGTGTVAANLQPAITVVDNTAANMTAHIPIAVMQGTTAGRTDVHYGNNVLMRPSRRFTVRVAVGGQHATFHVATPPAS